MTYKKKKYFKILLTILLYPIFLLYTNIFNSKIDTEKTVKKKYIEKNNIEKNMDINTIDFTRYKKNCCGAIIIGGGPAGLTAATYASRFGIPTTIIMGQEPGGALMKTGVVENWPGIVKLQGRYIIEEAIKQAEYSGANIVYEYVTKIEIDEWPFKIITNKNVYYAFSIMLSTGSTIKKLGCEGEAKYWGKGVSSCAICDALLHTGKSVLVIGGGDSACEEALQLIPHVDSVYLLVRSNKMRASHAMQEKINNNKKITILYNTQVKEIIGNDDHVVDAILLTDEVEYTFSEKYKDKTLSGVFLAIGQLPNTDLVKDIVIINDNGLIQCQNRTQKTSFPGIFCGGDVSNNYKQAGIACGEGTMAAIDMFNFLQHHNIDTTFYEKHKTIWLEKEVSNNCIDGVCNINTITIPDKNVQPEKKIYYINSEKEFKNIASQNKDSYYIIDIYGSGCPACEVIKGVFNQYIKKNPKLPIYLINYEKIQSIINVFKVRGVPTILLMKNGKVIDKKVGSCTLKEFEAWINNLIK